MGYRFHPTDEEIVGDYVRPKNLESNTSHVDEVMNTVDIYEFDPSELAGKCVFLHCCLFVSNQIINHLLSGVIVFSYCCIQINHSQASRGLNRQMRFGTSSDVRRTNNKVRKERDRAGEPSLVLGRKPEIR